MRTRPLVELRSRPVRTIAACSLLTLGALVAADAQGTTTSAARPTLFRGVRVFDGSAVSPSRDVLIRDGKIAAVGGSVAVPAGAEVVDGRGKTLFPGLIDSHTHAFADALRDALVMGVTTELDMFTEANMARSIKKQQAEGALVDVADLRSAGTLVTAPKGHGTEYGMVIPTITAPGEAQAFVDARIAEGSDYIKIVYDDGSAYKRSFATLDRATLTAVIEAAHKRGKLAVVHIGARKAAREAIESGADGLVHLFADEPPDADFGAFVASRKAFVIPTLAVLASIGGKGGGAALAEDARIAPYMSPMNIEALKRTFPARDVVKYDGAVQAVRQLKAAGVPILAGTDAPNPGTGHGASMHRELELLVQAGLTPAEALRAATAAPAAAFRLGDRGRIATGLRADLVLVNGDPTADITATREIVGVWKQGVRLDRERIRSQVAAARAAAATAAPAAAPAGSESGVVSDFDDGTTKAAFGAGWEISTDEIAGGKSSAKIAVVPGGAEGTTGALAVSGTIDGALPYAWAGAMFSPGATAFAPANLSAKKEVRFWAKGDGKTYRVMLFAQSKGQMPLTRTFEGGAEWKEYVFPLSAFGGTDGRDIMALIFSGGPAPGAFALQIDGVRIR